MSVAPIKLSTPQVFWYGERGIINAVVCHITRNRGVTGRIQAMLCSVLWRGGTLPSWLNQIDAVSIVIELGLADFGDPDVLLVCQTSQGTRLVFIEAKVLSYTDSMQSTSPMVGTRWGMSQEGFNSSINGQLTLKYRFARALSRWDGQSPVITESAETFAAYQQRLNDSPAKAPGRTLAKPAILNGILKPLGLNGIPEASCCYVALTWDSANKVFFNCPEVPQDCLPVFLDDTGADIFPSVTDRVGWLGYREMQTALGLDECAEYQAAFRTMLDSEQPAAAYYVESKKGRWTAFPPHIVAFASNIAAEFHERAQKWNGSFSLHDENRQTIGKIIPNSDSVFVGVRAGLPVANLVAGWASAANGVLTRKVKNVEFKGVNVREIREAQDFILALTTRLDAPITEQEDDTV